MLQLPGDISSQDHAGVAEAGPEQFPSLAGNSCADPFHDMQSMCTIPAVMPKLLFTVTTLLQMCKPNYLSPADAWVLGVIKSSFFWGLFFFFGGVSASAITV